ncbi:MAG: SPOR domain-containing protein [Methanophagales archaeon]|nr:SPOR domain-containing protein [Methanophagales archaeon]
MGEKKKFYTIKLTKKGLFFVSVGAFFALLWMFVLGIFVGQELIYLPSLPRIQVPIFSKSPKTVPGQEKPKQYSVQVGAFKNIKNALKFQNELSHKGYKTFIKDIKNNSHIYYRVYVGPYPLEKALGVYDTLSTQNYSPAKPSPLP